MPTSWSEIYAPGWKPQCFHQERSRFRTRKRILKARRNVGQRLVQGSRLRGSEGSAQSAARVRQKQIDAAGVRDEVVVPRAGVFLLGFAHEPFEVREES